MDEKVLKNTNFEILEVKAPDTDGSNIAIVSGIANKVGIVDIGRDMTIAGTFTKTVSENRKVPTLAGHNHGEPIGLAELSEDSDGSLLAKLAINKDVQKGAEFLSLIKQYHEAERPMQMSIGYFIKDVEYKEIDGRNVRILKEVSVFEVSVVPVGMNQESDITTMKKQINDIQTELANSKDEQKRLGLVAKIQGKINKIIN